MCRPMANAPQFVRLKRPTIESPLVSVRLSPAIDCFYQLRTSFVVASDGHRPDTEEAASETFRPVECTGEEMRAK
ncbi:hypothetical protein, partial [Enterococcus sp. HPCN18]|uniref:hypothetical protein n=1 Tax=Enterococcus sp. HPCN18 TaxID=2248751 RepID=UPI001C65CA1D